MKRSRALSLIAVSATASLPLLSAAPGLAPAANAAGPAAQATQKVSPAAAGPSAPARYTVSAGKALHLFAGGRLRSSAVKVTAAWLPKGCRLVEIGPANAGYTQAQMCTLPKGFHLRRGYMLVRGTVAPSVHSSSGASGAP